jgi:hypothetical protein
MIDIRKTRRLYTSQILIFFGHDSTEKSAGNVSVLKFTRAISISGGTKMVGHRAGVPLNLKFTLSYYWSVM